MPDAQKIDKPASVKRGGSDNTVIRVMPKEFFGRVALDTKKVAPAPVAAPPVVAPKPVPVPVKKTVQPPKKKSKSWVWILIILLVAILSIGGYFAWDYVQNTAEIEDSTPIPEPIPEPIPVPVPEPEPLLPTRSQDTDSDGLTDKEEELYGTDYRNPDSDGDSFLDGNEVFHRYNPLGLAPSTLLDIGAVVEYSSVEESPVVYSITYPVEWKIDQSQNLVSFVTRESTDSDGFSTRLYEKTSADQSIQDWYTEIVAPSNGASDLKVITTKNGYSGMESGDQRRVYLDLGEYVVELVYELDETLVIHYAQTFQMFVNSFSVQP